MYVRGVVTLAAARSLTMLVGSQEAHEPGTFAANCLLARRMVQRGVRFIQIFHRGWDLHSGLGVDPPS